MILKYISFLVGIIWSYSIIKTQSVFSKKTGLIFKVFISNVSWLTLLAACYFGYKNFSIQYTIIGIITGIRTIQTYLNVPTTTDATDATNDTIIHTTSAIETSITIFINKI